MDAYVTTITHELYHVKEFIEASNGLTPYMFQNEIECGSINATMFEAITGYGVDIGPSDNEDEDPNFRQWLVNEMEERVENKGRELTTKLNLPSSAYETVFKAYNLNKRAYALAGLSDQLEEKRIVLQTGKDDYEDLQSHPGK